MIHLVIDNHEVEVPEGGTILDAARRARIDIPTLCHCDGFRPATSCMLCLVKLKVDGRLVPSCATLAEEGMQVESETEEVHQLRRTGLELLLSDHLGDCTAPCQSACPAHMDIPRMLRQVASGDLREAIATVKKDIALPAVLGRVCPALCERACRRSDIDQAVAICLVKRYVADQDLASKQPYEPPCKPDTGKQVAIIGAGPAGLSAAYHLLQQGHACTLFDERAAPGGILLCESNATCLPRDMLDAEIAIIHKLGARFQLGTTAGSARALTELREAYDAIVLTVGPVDEGGLDMLGIPVVNDHPRINRRTYDTILAGVFITPDAVQSERHVVRSVAGGKAVSVCVDQYLSGLPVTGSNRAFTVHAGRMCCDEIEQCIGDVGRKGRVTPEHGPAAGLTDAEARAEARRCLHCDCGRQHSCRLRHYAARYGANPRRYRGAKRSFEHHLQHADIIYEPGKCILCGLCIQVATEADESLGLTFIGRGFNVRVGVPFSRSLAEGLSHAGLRCAEVCPTGALVHRRQDDANAEACDTCAARLNTPEPDEDD